MKLLWTKSNNIGSKLIEWGTNGDCSHFAVVFDDKPGGYGLVFHSHITGADLDYLGSFKEKHQIIHAMMTIAPLDEEAIYQSIVSRFNHRPYDKLAFLYFGMRIFMHKFFGVAMPIRNQWGDKSAFLCTEIADVLRSCGIPGFPDFEDYGMVSPIALFVGMKAPWVECSPP